MSDTGQLNTTIPTAEEGAFRRVITPNGVGFKKIDQPAATGQAYVETERAKTKRELEMEIGAKRVAQVAEQNKNRPPRQISEAERRAQPTNTPVFRPNSVYADRINRQSGQPVDQALGAMMRRVGGNVPKPEAVG